MTADVLIVGAGSAGSILAERLSADPARQVTVVEAGPARSDPAIRAMTDDATILPIGPRSPVLQRFATQLTDDHTHPAQIVRGACLGGSGAVNGGYFCRASPADFGEAPPGWSWADVEPHYRAITTDHDFPGWGAGPIPVRRVNVMCSRTAAFITAAQASGFGWLPDLNAAGAGVGVAAVPLNIADGIRVGPGAAFLEPVLDRPNLTVLTDVRVRRIRTAAGRAVGVQALGRDGPIHLDAQTVILSAGAVASAQLLLLSGIGPARASARLDIPVVADLPVGQRFSDHPEWVMSTDWPPADHRPVLEAVLVTDELEVRPYTSGFAAMTGRRDRGHPDIGVVLTRPRSRGRLTCVSADPDVAPRIEHRYDSHPGDVADLHSGCELVADILRGATILGEPRWSTSQHLCGTAPMGVGDGSVVDPRCRVHGVDGLAVIDGSVLPRIPGRGPHATIAMLAHRAAEFF